jgi:type III secretory pathway component EscT
MPEPWGTLLGALSAAGVDPRALALGAARVAPSVIIVPAFGLRGVPLPTRLLLAILIGASISPAIGEPAANAPMQVSLLRELLKGVPVAVSAAIALWTASMTGGLIDHFRGTRELSASPVVEGGSSPLGALFSMLASAVFLQTGGPTRIASALQRAGDSSGVIERVVAALLGGVEFAVAIAAPLVATVIVVEVAAALLARAMAPAVIHSAVAPIRSLVVLGTVAMLLERMMELLASRARLVP